MQCDLSSYGSHVATGPGQKSLGESQDTAAAAHPGNPALLPLFTHRNGCHSTRAFQSQPPSSSLSPAIEAFPPPQSSKFCPSPETQLHSLLSPCMVGINSHVGVLFPHDPCVRLPLPTTLEAPRELGLLMSRPSKGPIQTFNMKSVHLHACRSVAPNVLVWVSVHGTYM